MLSIICQRHRGGQLRARARVSQVVGDVREERLPCVDPFGCGDGFREREVCRVRTFAQRIEHHHLHPLEERPGLGRDPAAVGEIRKPIDPETLYQPLAVIDRDRCDPRSTRFERSLTQLATRVAELADPARTARDKISMFRLLEMTPINKTPKNVPIALPRPPVMGTPPMTTAPMARSSIPTPVEGNAAPKRESSNTDATPTRKPFNKKKPIVFHSTRIPAKNAARGLLPIEKSRLPVRV